MNRTESPPYRWEVLDGESKHHLAVEVVLDAVTLVPTAEVAIERGILESARGGEAIAD
jgi:hypothetical protein